MLTQLGQSRPVRILLKSISFLVASLFLMEAASAEEIPEHYLPVRPAGLGGAFTAVANDESAVWTNPAGVSRVRKARSRKSWHVFRFPNAIVGANQNTREFYDGYKASQEKNVQQIIEQSEKIEDAPFYARSALFPVAMFGDGKSIPFSVGMFSNTRVRAHIQKDDAAEAHIKAVSDYGGVISAAIANQTNRINLGVTIRPMTRYAYEDRVPSGDLQNKTLMQERAKDRANKATGLGVDVGFLYTMADFWFPTIGISVLNAPSKCKEEYLNPFTQERETVCGNVFTGDIQNEDAISTVDPTDVRIGFSVLPRFTRAFSVRFSVDAHHLPVQVGDKNYGFSGIPTSKMVHAGAELFFGNPLLPSPVSIRSGYSQGYTSFGATLNMTVWILEIASYGVDVSATDEKIEDRRYLASFTFGF